MTTFLADPDVTLYQGDVLDVLRELPDGSVDCVMTSPPYWGLRDYGTEGQLGLEPTPDEYVTNMVAVFREVRRVLADHGTCWVNMGDSYANQGGHGGQGESSQRQKRTNLGEQNRGSYSSVVSGLKPKDLVGIPWRVAFALQADGWYLRSDIIWSKPNPMPESVTDRPTKAHEYVFLLSKSARYFFDQEAVREPFSGNTHSRGSLVPRDLPKSVEMGQGIKNNRSMTAAIWGQAAKPPPQAETLDGSGGEAPRGPDGRRQRHVEGRDGSEQHRSGERWPGTARNIRSVWEIATQPYPEAHFATFPEDLVRRCVLAGCPEWVCRVCGKPRERIVERQFYGSKAGGGDPMVEGFQRNRMGGQKFYDNEYVAPKPLGWSDCGHDDYRTGVVFDPFVGSGTTCLVARNHGRHSIGIDLKRDYLELAARRLQQLRLPA